MKTLFMLIVLFFVASCSSTLTEENKLMAKGEDIHQHVIRLGNKLFSTSKKIQLNEPVAVGTFLPIKQLSGKNLPDENVFGHKIQESFITIGMQAGLNIIEFKTMPSIKLQNGYDIMLSRDTKDLNNKINAKYFLTGTYTEEVDHLIVNARIIELETQKVVAAATDYIPRNMMMSQQKITMNNGMIHRN